MALTVKRNTVYAVEEESTAGTYEAPSAATSYVQTLTDGAEIVPAKELLERDIFNGTLGKVTPRTGTKSVSGSLPVEMRAGENEGDLPEWDTLMRGALGSREQLTSSITKTGHTASVLEIEDADISKYQVNDIVLVKEAGNYHVSPIAAVDDTLGAANITLAIPMDAAPADNVELAASTQYRVANSGHPSLSVSKYIEDAVLEAAVGVKVTSLSLDNFTTGQLASFNFGFEGLTYERSLTSSPFAANYQDSLPPIILDACVYQDGAQIQVNELTFSLENTLGFVTSTCSPNGRISSRVTERDVTGTFNPYKQDDSLDQFNRFDQNSEYSLFASAHIPTSNAGEKTQAIAFHMPACTTTELAETDQDEVLQDSISFTAGRGSDAATDEIVIATF
jgi:hypothetical protein